MKQTCIRCSKEFSVTDEDRAFLKKLSPVIGGKTEELPLPTHCPDCRQQRRVTQGNQLHLYKRTCNFSGKPIISNYHPDAPYPVYNLQTWWSDQWDAADYGREFDFSRPFFDQYAELLRVAPRFALHTTFEFDQNSEYVNYCTKNKNCYLIFDSDLNENCYYCYSINRSRDCMDCYRVGESELCYECVDTNRSYRSAFLQDCENCSDSMFLKNCIGCRSCLFCSNLQNKEYHIENKPVSKEEFEAAAATLRSRDALSQSRQHFRSFALRFPQKAVHGVQNEDVTGDYLTHCKNAHECYDSRDLWDCRYNHQGWMSTRDAMDTQEVGDCEMMYETCYAGSNGNGFWFSTHCFECRSVFYSSFCMNSHDLFGCVSMKRAQYCILNKQYTKEEYEALVPKIIAHMKKTGEWGEFLPMRLASFCYNETQAQDYFPLTKKQAEAEGLQWRDDDQRTATAATIQTPDTIDGVPDSVTQEILQCSECSKNYRITGSELQLLRTLGLPLPDRCFFCRNKTRFSMRNKRKLCDRACQNCGKEIRTTYAPDAPDAPDVVFCEECYLHSLA